VVEAEAATVRRIFNLCTKDRLGTRAIAIATVLNDRGLRTKRGKPSSQRSVETVINNRQYLGEKNFRDITAHQRPHGDIHWFNADELETAIGQALLDFYATGHDIIEQAISDFLNTYAQATSGLHDELASVTRQLRDNAAAVDRYLTSFERGTLDDEDPEIQARPTKFKIHSKQLRTRKAHIEFDLEGQEGTVRGANRRSRNPGRRQRRPALPHPDPGNRRRTDPGSALDQLPVDSTVRVLPHGVGRRHHHANPAHVVVGDPLPLALRRSRGRSEAR
jgi:hypothetical protein